MFMIINIAMIVIPIVFIAFELRRISSNYKRISQQPINVKHVNENSFQRFAKFYDETYPHEEKFDAKLNQIYILITKNGERDIQKIAELTSCKLPECVIKIKYLKNKRLPYIYGSRAQVEDFYQQVPWEAGLSEEAQKKKILEEIKYLADKGLIIGVKVDDIDGRIIYYSIEKRKTVYNRETTHCPNCGALNDVEITGKTRCDYCKGIVMGSAFKDVNEES